MKKIALALLLSVASMALGACDGLPTLNIQSQVNLNTIEGVAAGYGILLNAENSLKAVPLCKTGTSPSATNICVKRSLIVRLQSADRVAYQAVLQAETFVKNNPSVSPGNYVSAAQAALLAAQAIINSAATPGV
jgi:hypothetical protein